MQTFSENKTKPNPFYFVPNIIEYVRILLIFIAAYFSTTAPIVCFSLLFIEGNLDAVDGYMARRLKQESPLGTILDYAIDRASLAFCIGLLIHRYPQLWGIFTFVLALDIFSHFCQLYTSAFLKFKSHMAINNKQGVLLRSYYTNRYMRYGLCFSHDFMLIMLYLYSYYPSAAAEILIILCMPGFILKTILHIIQAVTALRLVAAIKSA